MYPSTISLPFPPYPFSWSVRCCDIHFLPRTPHICWLLPAISSPVPLHQPPISPLSTPTPSHGLLGVVTLHFLPRTPHSGWLLPAISSHLLSHPVWNRFVPFSYIWLAFSYPLFSHSLCRSLYLCLPFSLSLSAWGFNGAFRVMPSYLQLLNFPEYVACVWFSLTLNPFCFCSSRSRFSV